MSKPDQFSRLTPIKLLDYYIYIKSQKMNIVKHFFINFFAEKPLQYTVIIDIFHEMWEGTLVPKTT